MWIVHSQESSKKKGPLVSTRRKARSWPLSLEVLSFAPKCNLDGGGSMEANLTIFRCSLVSNKGVVSPVPKISQDITGETEKDEGLSCCSLVNKMCLPFSASSEQDHHLARAFVPKSLPVSSVSTVSSFWCPPFFFYSVGVKLCFLGFFLFEFSWC